jgi:hypothetical protein
LAELRTTDRLPRELEATFDGGLHIDGYRVREVVLPKSLGRRAEKTALEIVILGRNFAAVAQPLTAFVGEVPVEFLRIAPDQRRVDGLLLEEPPKGARVRMELGDQDAVQHADPFDPERIRRING